MLFKVPPPKPNAIRKIRRLAVVLPLKLASGKVIPIPYIVDTGAPGIVYFGTKTVTILNSMNLIKNVHYNEFHYLVSGVITCGKKKLLKYLLLRYHLCTNQLKSEMMFAVIFLDFKLF